MSFATEFSAERPRKGQALRVARSGQGTTIVGDNELQQANIALSRRKFSPVEIAANKVGNVLSSYSKISKTLRDEWVTEIQRLDQLVHMSPELVAAALVFLNDLEGRNELTSADFTQQRFDMVLAPIPIESKDRAEEIRKRYQQSIARYVVNIATMRST